MDKFFSPSKYFVLFCALFIGVFLALQMVITARLETAAKTVGEDVFTWVWADENLRSTASDMHAKVLKKSDASAVVEVTGDQKLSPFETGGKVQPATTVSPCKAIVTLYKQNSYWKVGKVELQ